MVDCRGVIVGILVGQHLYAILLSVTEVGSIGLEVIGFGIIAVTAKRRVIA
jgi:hypothetical protein